MRNSIAMYNSNYIFESSRIDHPQIPYAGLIPFPVMDMMCCMR
jgi:hypothetical protein